MNIPDQYYEMLLTEFKDAQKLSNETELIEDKIYYFSATYGIINRIMNFYCDSILVFMHQVLKAVHIDLTNRLQRPNRGAVSTSFPTAFIEALFTYLNELIVEFEKKNEDGIRKVLEKFSNLSYATTGNGYYLFLRNKLSL